MSEPLRLLTVHAHPDDEASKGAASVAKYTDAGHRAVLVCCTGGEEGDVLNPEMDRPDVRERLTDVRRQELATAAAIIGYHEVHYLGYRDSGMPDSEANAHPESFAVAPLEEAIGRLVGFIRQEKPHVLVTYSDDQGGYRHPDHIRVHDISVPAYQLAADATAYPEAGEPWEVAKLYYTAWSRARIEAVHQAFLDHGIESPYDERWFDRENTDHRITTKVEIEQWYHRRDDALRAHRTQVDPSSPFWFGLPAGAAAAAYPYDDYILADSRVPTDVPESDLLAGLRQPVG